MSNNGTEAVDGLPGTRSISMQAGDGENVAYVIHFDGPLDGEHCKLLFGKLVDAFGKDVAFGLGAGRDFVTAIPTDKTRGEYKNSAPVLSKLQQLLQPRVPLTGWGYVVLGHGTYQVLFRILGWKADEVEAERAKLIERLQTCEGVLHVTTQGETDIALTHTGDPEGTLLSELSDRLAEPLGIQLTLQQGFNSLGDLLSGLFRN